MKEKKFIELVNLYIDREISPQDAERVEIEIQNNPKRQRIYRDYCRLHRASLLLAERFVAPGAEPLEEVEQTVRRAVAEPRHRRLWWFVSGGSVAAACLALIGLKLSIAEDSAGNSAVVRQVADSNPEPLTMAVLPAEERDSLPRFENGFFSIQPPLRLGSDWSGYPAAGRGFVSFSPNGAPIQETQKRTESRSFPASDFEKAFRSTGKNQAEGMPETAAFQFRR